MIRSRRFRDTSVPEVGLGCWQLGGDADVGDWGGMSDAFAAGILETAWDAGCRLFDTAEGYGGGRSEQRLGQVLGGRPDALIATKLGRNRADGDVEANLQAGTADSLARLARDRIFLTQLHCWPPEMLDKSVWDGLRRLQHAGLVKHIGASVETVAAGHAAIDAGAEAVQIIFNAFRQRPLTEGLLDRCARENVGVLVRLPLASGLLAKRFGDHGYASHDDLPEGDHRRYNRDGNAFNVGETLAGLTLKDGIAAAEAALPILTDNDRLFAPQAALRWVLDHDAVTCVIPGASQHHQARDNAAASALPPLDLSVHERLRTLWQTKVDPKIRGAQ
jgi:aryl-alcohol dehydrogenase-like predicted oxidoreductase